MCWIAGRKDLLSGFFFLSSLIAYISYLHTEQRNLFFLSLLTFLLALLSKVSAITLPFVLLLVTLFEGRTLTKQTLVDLIPFPCSLNPLWDYSDDWEDGAHTRYSRCDVLTLGCSQHDLSSWERFSSPYTSASSTPLPLSETLLSVPFFLSGLAAILLAAVGIRSMEAPLGLRVVRSLFLPQSLLCLRASTC